MQVQNPIVEVWKSIHSQVDCWAMTPAVRDLLAGLPRSGEDHAREVPARLQELKAGHGSIMTNALRLGYIVEMLIGGEAPSSAGNEAPANALNDWIRTAQQVEQAHHITVSWIRSRLPDYPIIRAPHLARHTAYTTDDFTHLLSWPLEHQKAGFQRMPEPPPLDALLRNDSKTGQEITGSTAEVARSLGRTDAWAAFAHAAHDLSETGKKDLRAARRTIAERLSPAAMDEYEPGLVMARVNFRTHVLNEVAETLSGCAREYADAFGAVNRLIDRATSEIFGALLTQIEVPTLPATKLEFGADLPHTVEFELPGAYGFLMECGDLAWLDSQLMSDAVRLESINYSFNATGSGGTKVGATILEGTADAWPR